MRRWLVLTFVAGASVACTAGHGGGGASTDTGSGAPSPGPTPISADAGASCVRPDEGCPCDPGAGPIDCYLDPLTGPGGELICNEGTRYCRDGAWTACESIRSYTIQPEPGALITGPDPCNPCDPRCFTSRDTPTPGDLTPGRATGVTYDTTTGGITITPLPPSTSTLTDGDGDGVPDVADQCPGAGFVRNPDGTCYTGTAIYHTLPYGSSALDSLNISTQIRTADVYFLMDTTGSMGGELSRLQTDLTSGSFISGCGGGIIGAIRCTIPDAWFGVGFHDDYPVSPYGGAGYDYVYRNRLDIQSSVSAAQSAVNSLSIHWGNDGPEAQTQALWAISTGGGLSSYLSPRTGCPAGTWGYPCFRSGTIPIVVLITDAPFHNGPGGAYPYCIGGTYSSSLPPTTAVSGNERLDASARYVDVTDAWVGFTGNTSTMVDDVNFGCGSGARDAVFRVHLGHTQTTRFTLQGSSYDTVIGVFPVSGGGGWCNDDYVGTQSELDLTLAAGDYWVIVDGWSWSSGAYRLSMGVPVSSCSGYAGESWSDTVSALSSRGVRTIVMQTCGYWSDSYCLEGESHAQQLGYASGSVGSSGTPYVFRGSADGSGLSSAIVNAIVDLANYSRMDVSARVVGDTQGFTVLPITAVSWGPRGSCTGISGGTTFLQCLPGTDVNFRVNFRNDVVMPTSVPQVFDFSIELVGDGSIVLTRVPVRIVVPPITTMYPSSGSYWRDYDSTLRCDLATESPSWGQLSWVGNTPSGTRIDFELRAASTAAGVATATPIGHVITPSAASPVDLGAALRTAGYPDGMPFVRVTAVLYSDSTHTRTPTLTSMGVTYTCLPNL